jgi:hypothetical protein
MWTMLNIFKEKIGTGASFYLLLVFFNAVYFLTIFGIVYVDSSYLNSFNITVHSILCLFLIYRFNPMRKGIEITKYDQTIIFSISIFLLVNMGIIETLKSLYVDGTSLLVNDTKSSL